MISYGLDRSWVKSRQIPCKHVSLISDDAACSFYDLVQYIYYYYIGPSMVTNWEPFYVIGMLN